MSLMKIVINKETELVYDVKMLLRLFGLCAENYLGRTKILDFLAEKSLKPYLDVYLVSDEEIRELNNRTRAKDQVTDVLSYPEFNFVDERVIISAEELKMLGLEAEHNDNEVLFGSIIIATERARMQAENFAHAYLRELAFLFLHSLLHLCGYDHNTEEEAKEMEDLQDEILQELKITREASDDEILAMLDLVGEK